LALKSFKETREERITELTFQMGRESAREILIIQNILGTGQSNGEVPEKSESGKNRRSLRIGIFNGAP
jgi:hypothetical protein